MAVEPIGREQERAAIIRFLDDARSKPGVLVLEGEPGIGKSTLWSDALDGLEDRLVLSSRPTPSDSRASFSALGDLVEPILSEELPALSAPRRRALEVALLLREPGSTPLDAHGVAVATLDLLRHVADDRAVVVAIDDAPWIDSASARALRFAFRRLDRGSIAVLLAARTQDVERIPVALDGSTPPVERLRLDGISVAGIHRLVSDRLDVVLPRHVLVRMHEHTGGNPLYALELARALSDRDIEIGPHDPLPIPGSLRGLVAERLGHVSGSARRAVLVSASLSDPTTSVLVSMLGAQTPAALDEAVDAGILEIRDHTVHFTHPLLASVVLADAPAAERRSVHTALAGLVTDPEERGMHMALAGLGTDADAAAELDAAARHAAARGASDAAAALAVDALRLTPPAEADLAHRRGLRAIDHHFRAGDLPAAERLLDELLLVADGGSERAAILCRRALILEHDHGFPAAASVLQEASSEAAGDPWLRSAIEQEVAFAKMHSGDVPGAVAHAKSALALAKETGDSGRITDAAVRVASYEFISGEGVSPILAEWVPASGTRPEPAVPSLAPQPMFDVGMVLAFVAKSSDDFARARVMLEELCRTAEDEGNEAAIPFILSHLSELEFWTGNWDRAVDVATRGLRIAEQCDETVVVAVMQYTTALVLAGRGDVDRARELAEQAKCVSLKAGNVPVMLMASSALGFIDLSVGDAAGTHRHLGDVSAGIAAMGTGEPGCLRFMADEIEALVRLGDLDAASTLTAYLEERGRTLDRPWALATGARSRGLVLAASGDIKGAAASLDRALEEHRRLEMPLELGRSLLASGSIRRRAKQKRAAKEALSAAIAVFDRLGARLWGERAREELARVGLRPAAPTELTPTEERVADLVASGRTNREVAGTLFMSVKTVDSNLSRIYRKLNVRSRTELACRYATTGTHPS